MITKRKERAFGKDVFLLGVDEQGDNVWLESPSWDCGWYWGFGYVERYTNSNPSRAKDITSHTHIDSEFKINDIINVRKGLVTYTFSVEEGKELNDLFAWFYKFKELADSYHQSNPDACKKVNEIDIPKITGRIIEILTPAKV